MTCVGELRTQQKSAAFLFRKSAAPNNEQVAHATVAKYKLEFVYRDKQDALYAYCEHHKDCKAAYKACVVLGGDRDVFDLKVSDAHLLGDEGNHVTDGPGAEKYSAKMALRRHLSAAPPEHMTPTSVFEQLGPNKGVALEQVRQARNYQRRKLAPPVKTCGGWDNLIAQNCIERTTCWGPVSLGGGDQEQARIQVHPDVFSRYLFVEKWWIGHEVVALVSPCFWQMFAALGRPALVSFDGTSNKNTQKFINLSGSAIAPSLRDARRYALTALNLIHAYSSSESAIDISIIMDAMATAAEAFKLCAQGDGEAYLGQRIKMVTEDASMAFWAALDVKRITWGAHFPGVLCVTHFVRNWKKAHTKTASGLRKYGKTILGHDGDMAYKTCAWKQGPFSLFWKYYKTSLAKLITMGPEGDIARSKATDVANKLVLGLVFQDRGNYDAGWRSSEVLYSPFAQQATESRNRETGRLLDGEKHKAEASGQRTYSSPRRTPGMDEQTRYSARNT